MGSSKDDILGLLFVEEVGKAAVVLCGRLAAEHRQVLSVLCEDNVVALASGRFYLL